MNNKMFGLILAGLFASMHIQSMNEEEQQLEISRKLDEAWEGFNKAWHTLRKRLWSLWMADNADPGKILQQYMLLRTVGAYIAQWDEDLFRKLVTRSSKDIIVLINDKGLGWKYWGAQWVFEAVEQDLGQRFLFIMLDADMDYAVMKKLGITRAPKYALHPPVYVLLKGGRDYTFHNAQEHIIKYNHPSIDEDLQNEVNRIKNEIATWLNHEDKCAK
jgi:hypothetical protein